MHIIGITGNIATGKSTVGRLLREKGYYVLDLDKVSRDLLMKNKEKLGSMFPVLMENNEFSKVNLKKIIFSKGLNHKEIERFLHLRIFIRAFFLVLWKGLCGHTVVFIEIPLFMEYDLDYFFDSIVVYTDKHTQAKRIVNRDGLKFLDEKLRISGNLLTKKERATFVIDNSKSIEKTKQQIENLKLGGIPIHFNILLVMIVIYSLKTLVNAFTR